MWGFYQKIVVRRLLSFWPRALVLLVVVALTTALAVAVVEAGEEAVASFEESSSLLEGAAEAKLVVVGGALPTDRLTPLLRGLSRSLTPEPRYSLPITLRASKGEFGTTLEGRAHSLAPLLDKAASSAPELPVGKKRLVLLSDEFASRTGLRLGETFAVTSSHGTTELVVGSILSEASGATLFTDLHTVYEVAGGADQVSSIGLLPRGQNAPGFHAKDIAQLKRSLESYDLPLRLSDFTSRRSKVRTLLSAFRTNILVLVAVTMLVTGFTMFNGTQLASIDLLPTCATLRTLGASRLFLFLLVLGEVAVVSALGVFGGLSLGQPLSSLIASLFLRTVQSLYLKQEILSSLQLGERASLFALVGASAFVASILGACLPAWRVSSTPPAVVRASSAAGEGALPQLRKIGMGILLLAFTALLCMGAAQWRSLTLSYIAIGSLLGGILLVTPPLIIATLWQLRPFLIRRFAVSSLIAAGNLGRGAQHLSLPAAVAGLGVALLVAMAVLISSFRSTLGDWMEQTFQADIILQSSVPHSATQFSTLAPGVEGNLPDDAEVSYLSMMNVFVGDRLLQINGISFAQAQRHQIYQLLSGRLPISSEMGVVLSESAAYHLGLAVGASVTLVGESFQVLGIYKDFSRDSGTVLMERSRLLTLRGDKALHGISLYLPRGLSSEAIADRLRLKLAGLPVTVTEVRNLKKTVYRVFDETFSITTVMRATIAVIAGFGFSVALVQLLFERRRTLRILKIIGVGNFSLVASLLMEGAVLIFPALLIGTVGGYLLSFLLVELVNPFAFGWTLNFYTSGSAVILPMVVLVVGLLFGVLAAMVSLPRLLRDTRISDE